MELKDKSSYIEERMSYEPVEHHQINYAPSNERELLIEAPKIKTPEENSIASRILKRKGPSSLIQKEISEVS